jgi:chemotaxis protein methyltransferase CheR
VRDENLLSLDLLCKRLAENKSPALSRQVVEAMTTNETLFFRDIGMFEGLKTEIIPALFEAARGKRKVRIWSAASSTGQEAYSIAMLLLEQGIGPHQVEIVGTDLAQGVLNKAASGKYLQFEVSRGLPSTYLAKYFSKTGLDWQLSSEVRNMVRFQQLDLRSNLDSMGPCDLVLCRNVLIYFDIETKKAILSAIKRTLAPGGCLILGCAETVINLDNSFHRKMASSSVFYSVR